jgi:hypothetical protein
MQVFSPNLDYLISGIQLQKDSYEQDEKRD